MEEEIVEAEEGRGCMLNKASSATRESSLRLGPATVMM